MAGRAMVMHTLDAFDQVERLTLTLVAVAPGDSALAVPGERFAIVDCGGATRAQTVLNALAQLHQRGAKEDDWVLVHDAARCLVTPALIDRLIDACAADPVGGLLAQPAADTLKRGEEGRVTGTLSRTAIWLAQTPQMFRLGLLAEALQRAGPGVTDEAGAVEALGHQPLLVAGTTHNFKVTYPEDFALAEAVLRSRQP
jgi:2-C-methyl-D-erythritol 4-phosphate cytidylyltransferase